MKNRFIASCAVGVLAAGLMVAPRQASAAPEAKAGNVEKGKEVFEQCGVCHNADSTDKKMGPGLKGLYKKEKLANGKKVTDANVLHIINNGGNGMPAYADMLSDEERADLMAYLKTL
jgi:cytochrome c